MKKGISCAKFKKVKNSGVFKTVVDAISDNVRYFIAFYSGRTAYKGRTCYGVGIRNAVSAFNPYNFKRRTQNNGFNVCRKNQGLRFGAVKIGRGAENIKACPVFPDLHNGECLSVVWEKVGTFRDV